MPIRAADRSHLSPMPRPAERDAVQSPSLPEPLTSFIGRAREVATVAALLRRDDVRLVTLTGPGGVGKTRLALRVAEDVAGDFPDGVWFVSLAPIRDSILVIPTIAQAMGVRDVGGRPIDESLAASIRHRRILLVLDNLEHVVSAAPRIADLLVICPTLTILATSRAILRLTGEHVVPVPPLSLGEKSGVRIEENGPRTSHSDAVRLFARRAEAVRPDFALGPENAETIIEICRRLDGLPLAIELAAARVRHLTPRALLELLELRLPLLTGGSADQPERHQTLGNAIAWSHDLLSPEEQALLCRLAVFVGGFTLSAAETIAKTERGGDGETGSEIPPVSPSLRPSVPVLDLLTSLADKSLLQSVAWPETEPRLEMLETVREFAAERLAASGETETVRRAHATYYVGLIERASAEMDGARMGRSWLDRTEAEYGNVRAALATFAEYGDQTREMRLASSSMLFWYYQGRLREGIACLETALGRDGPVPPNLRARALADLAYLHGEAGDTEAACAFSAESVALTRTVEDDDALLAWALFYQGLMLRWDVRLDAAVAVLEESLAVGGRLDPRPPAWTLTLGNLGAALLDKGERERGLTLVEEALALSRAHGMNALAALLLARLGQAAQVAGEVHLAATRYGESLRLSWAITTATFLDRSIVGLAGLAAETGRPEAAARLLGAIESSRTRTGITILMWPEVGERAAATARASLGEVAFEAAIEAGRRLSPAEVEAETLALAAELATGAAPPGIGATSAALAQDGGLTARELEILRLLADGKSHVEIAADLFISRRTVDNHGTKILAKLEVRSSRAAVAEARRRGIL